MLCYQDKVFRQDDLPDITTEVCFYRCKFIGHLPCFRHCEFHDCDLSDARVYTLTSCKLFSVNLDRADFSKADTRFSITNRGSPCSAKDCTWVGMIGQFDCSFLSGLIVDDKAINLFSILALIPDYPSKSKFYRELPAEIKQQTRKILTEDFRHG